MIPDAGRRSDALLALSDKRASIEGASLFCILPDRRDRRLLTLLIAYQILADYLDEVDEHNPEAAFECRYRLQALLQDALRPSEIRSSARHAVTLADGGYLAALIACCRTSYASLPSSAAAAPLVAKATALTQVQCINHDPDPSRRKRELRAWAGSHTAAEPRLLWFEAAAAASAWLTVLAMLALAADPTYDESVCHDVYHAYHPWISLLGTMLDSYGDLLDDLARDAHSYIAYYSPGESIVRPLVLLVDRAMSRAAGCVRDAPRHQVIVASMVAMYIATADSRTPELAAVESELMSIGGWLLSLTMLASRAWVRLRAPSRRVALRQARPAPATSAHGMRPNAT